MRNQKIWMFATGLLSAVVHGCYNDGEVCQVGLAVVCEGAGGCNGMQVCTPEGVFSACECEAEGTSGEGGAAETSSGAATSETSGGAASSEGGETSGHSGTVVNTFGSSGGGESTTEMSTGGSSTGEPEPDCMEMCMGKCGGIECGGEYYECGGCQGEEICVDNVCTPPCTERELFFVNAGVAVSPVSADSQDSSCAKGAKGIMTITMEVVSSDPALSMTLGEGLYESRKLPYDEEVTLMLKCSRRTKLVCIGDVWPPCADDPMSSCKDFDEQPITIEADDCSPQLIVGCDAP